MSRPLFAVGEEFILESKKALELNGRVGTIVEIKGILEDDAGNYQYAYDTTLAHDGGTGWFESALRKKYPPSDVSFEQLMSSLKVKEKA